ncbi:MAG: DUF4364 family protein [Ruminococcus sp.]|nr:DUF4364 family protein [Ruminococcus sp.]
MIIIFKAGERMAFDTFDEGIVPGGIRSKNEIRTLICYILNSVGVPMSKEVVIETIQKQGLANYFETSSCFDDLISHKNIVPQNSNNNEKLYFVSENGKMIATQLESTLSYTVKEKAYTCALMLLEQRRIEKENAVTITKQENGYKVKCSISGGSVELLNFEIFAPDKNQAKLIKTNFHKNPELFYKTTIALLTKNKEFVGEALEDLYGIL